MLTNGAKIIEIANGVLQVQKIFNDLSWNDLTVIDDILMLTGSLQ